MNAYAKFRRGAIALSVCSVTFMAGSVNAQEADVSTEPVDSLELEEIVVSGSRIRRPEFSQPTPVVSITAEEIQRFGTPDLGSILAELPAVGATGTLSGNATRRIGESAGVSSPDLRRLGLARTLTLVNGRRHVAAVAGSSQVDLSTIPVALVERIDVVTGGASAVYGSDAVSGVVNLILKDDYEGFEVNVTGADSLESVENRNLSVSGVAGFNFSEERGNVTFFASVDDIEQTPNNSIRQFSDFGTIVNPDDTGEEDGIPDRLTVPNVLSERISRTGVLNPFGGGIGLYTFDDAGNPVLQTARDGTNSFAFGSFPNGCSTCFSLDDSRTYLPEVERFTVGSTFNYDINPRLNAYASIKYTESDIIQLAQPIFRFGNIFINTQDNAFLEPGLRQQLLDGGQNSVQFAKFLDELGFRNATNERELIQYSAGLKGDFSLGATDVNFDVSYSAGETDNIRITPSELIEDNFEAAVDSVVDPATGQPVCRSLTAGSVNPQDCVAYNPFGFGQASQAAIDFVTADVFRIDNITQDVFSATFVTDSSAFFTLPGGAVDVVSGFEYREESASTTTDALTQSDVTSNAATPDNFGEFDVTEFFTEVSFPIIKDSFINELTLDAAYRTADYSHAGSADAWKVGFILAPVESFRFRGTVGEAVRAPNISEAFDAQSPGFENIDDPCDADNIGDDPDRVGNCAALGIPAGFQANDNVSIDTFTGGNPNLVSEESESWTLGFIWQPSFADGLNVTLDYYDIEIADAIIDVLAQDILDNCVDATGGPDQGFCSQIDRNPVTNDVDLVRSGFLNAAARDAEGYELNIDYRGISLESLNLPGQLNLSLIANHQTELNQFDFQDRPDEINVELGEIGDPETQYRLNMTYLANNYFNATWTARYIDRSAFIDLGPNADIPEDLFPAFTPSITTHDINLNYRISEGVSIYGGLRNVFDKVPGGNVRNAIYDLVGRRAYVGLRARF